MGRRQHSASHGVVRIPTLGRKSANGETARDAHLAHRPRQRLLQLQQWHQLQRQLQHQLWHQLPPRPPLAQQRPSPWQASGSLLRPGAILVHQGLLLSAHGRNVLLCKWKAGPTWSSQGRAEFTRQGPTPQGACGEGITTWKFGSTHMRTAKQTGLVKVSCVRGIEVHENEYFCWSTKQSTT